MTELTSESRGFANSTEGLIKGVNKYKESFLGLLTSGLKLEYTTGEIEGARAEITPEEFSLICAIVESEAGADYDSALAVISCVVNRVLEGSWDKSWEHERHLKASPDTSDPLSVLTAEGQFEGYFSYSYLKYLNKTDPAVKQAVSDCLTKGKISHDYTCFRSYETAGSEKIGGNYYFLPLRVKRESLIYSIGGEDFDKASIDSAEGTWDLLYLIAAYDASKGNLRSEDEDITRYSDLIENIGEYIIKAIFGTTVKTSHEETIPAKVPVYEEVTCKVFDGKEIKEQTYLRKTGEEETTTPVEIPKVNPAGDIRTLNTEEDLTGFSLKADNSTSLTLEGDGQTIEVPVKIESDLLVKTGEVDTITPEIVEVEDEKRIYGLSKGVLLDVLGLSPGDPYSELSEISVSNSEFIEYSRSLMIKALNLTGDDYNLFGTTTFTPASSGGWIWPLDPNGRGAFIITSLMGTRESPGGIGSTNHGGTDIGAAYGTAILAVKDGTVEIASVYGGYGNCVRLNHGTFDDGVTYQTLYGHMSQIAVNVGESVKQGQVIGYVGSTGWSTGPHLHFELIKNGEKVNGLSLYGEDILSKLTYYL